MVKFHFFQFFPGFWLIAPLNWGTQKKCLGIFCSYACLLSTLQISAKSPKGSPRNSRSREVFLFFYFFYYYGHHDSGTHICVCRDQKGRGFAGFLAHSSLKLGHLEKNLGQFVAMHVLYLPCKFQRNRSMGVREIRDRARFFLWAPRQSYPYAHLSGPKGAWLCRFFGSQFP